MEKYSQDKESLLLGLRDEENRLMTEMAAFMSNPEKRAEEAQEMRSVEMRLQRVRSKITELDLSK